ncbi:MAG: homoserine dehydrogenase [Pseudomonadota bacterium]
MTLDATAAAQPLRVGLCGLGTVGTGLVELLRTNAAEIARQAGRDVQLTRVASRTPKPDVDLGAASFATDLESVVGAADVDVVVELIGGADVALEVTRRTLEAGRPIVTGNKALLALHGPELFRLAAEHDATIGFEAAVAGGVPIIGALQSGLLGNRIEWVSGIINGTCNYILTAMTQDGADFADVLAQAQALGYAEADPSFDVGGIDAAHKIAILASLAFGSPVDFDAVFVEGIESIGGEDIEYARRLGYAIKHVGIARRRDDGIEVRAHPALIPETALLAGVNGVSNAIVVKDNAVGVSTYAGAGAGAWPTAASVVADLVRVARGEACGVELGGAASVLSIEASASPYYLRAPVRDEPGVLAQLARLLGDEGISIESVIQREQAVQGQSGEDAWVPLVLLTQRVEESALRRALARIESQPVVVGPIVSLRVEPLESA